jgi:membrane-bound serine protease (ClpP class)
MIFGQIVSAMTRWASILIAGSMWVAGGSLRATEVGLIKIKGAIGPATAGYISRAIDIAAARKDACLIIQLDTPGGLLDSTKDIVQKFYASPVPTVVYVSPSGASAGSAGAFITLAADVAAMAPNTASVPRIRFPSAWAAFGKTDDVMKKKWRTTLPPSSNPSPTAAIATWSGPVRRGESKATTGEKASTSGVIDHRQRRARTCSNDSTGAPSATRGNTAKAEVFEIT